MARRQLHRDGNLKSRMFSCSIECHLLDIQFNSASCLLCSCIDTTQGHFQGLHRTVLIMVGYRVTSLRVVNSFLRGRRERRSGVEKLIRIDSRNNVYVHVCVYVYVYM